VFASYTNRPMQVMGIWASDAKGLMDDEKNLHSFWAGNSQRDFGVQRCPVQIWRAENVLYRPTMSFWYEKVKTDVEKVFKSERFT